MKIFTPSKNRAKTISTHRVFEDTIVVLHSHAQLTEYIQRGLSAHAIVSNAEPDAYGLTRQREYCCQFADRDEWILFADDNIHELWTIPFPAYCQEELDEIKQAMGTPQLASVVNKYRPKDERILDPQFFLDEIVPECIDKAEEVGACMVGFSVTDNPLFRTKKWGTTAYVSGKMFLYKNVGMPWDHTITMEDFRNSAWMLANYGRVLINRYIHPRATHYQEGGMGRPAERIPYRLQDIEKLMQQFPGLFRRKAGDYPDLSIRIHGEKAIDKWRASL